MNKSFCSLTGNDCIKLMDDQKENVVQLFIQREKHDDPGIKVSKIVNIIKINFI